MESNIKVSVYCLTYNHEKYIEQTLRGFVSQKTDFKFQVIVHDDASTDNTADIIRRYEQQYPDIIKGIYQEENQYSQGIKITEKFIVPAISGKYLAVCEGDDFWSDTGKLQRQVDAMDANPECFLCVHKTREIYADGQDTGKLFPTTDMEEGVIESRKFLSLCRGYNFHTSSYMFNLDEWKKYTKEPPEFRRLCDVGDECYLLYFGQLGSVYYIDKCMSAYRRGVVGSWSDRQAKATDVARLARHPLAMTKTLISFDKYTDRAYHDIIVPRIASMMTKAALLTKTSKEMLNGENREYFNALPPKKRVSVVIAAAFPNTVLWLYKMRLKKLNKRKGY